MPSPPSTIGRTSTVPVRAEGIRAAIPRASSSFFDQKVAAVGIFWDLSDALAISKPLSQITDLADVIGFVKRQEGDK
jgi:hypothetical protein